MRKKIFKVIGIVLAVALAFVGVVVGIMAISGKFKTQKIYPTELIFDNDNLQVVNYYDNHLYNFTITGIASNGKKVNQKTCYIYFVDRANNNNYFGEDLIMLCNEDGTPLQKQEGTNKYKVNCNEPIYYKLKNFGTNPAHFNKENYGIAVLQADDGRGMVKSNLLTISVDQAVEQIKLQGLEYGTETLNGKVYGVQSATVSLGAVLDFNLELLPNYALHPISNVENKKIEIYYYNGSRFETGKLDNDYELIDDEFLADPENNFVKYITNENEQKVLRFEPTTEGGNYKFVIAVFDSYQTQRNIVQTQTKYQRVDQMIYTVVDVDVTSDNVSEVEFNENLENKTDKVSLNLYTDDNYITLNGEPDLLTNTNNNDLGLKIDGATTSRRFDSVAFGTNMERFWANSNINFKDVEDRTLTFNLNSNNKFVTLVNFGELDGTYNYNILGNSIVIDQINATFAIAKGNITLNNRQLITTLNYNGENVQFSCSNGAAFVTNDSIVMLRTGSYLEFFNKNENNFEQTNFMYSATDLGGGANRSFNVVVKQLPEVENLTLMLLIVNSNGQLLTTYAEVVVEEQKSGLNYESLNHSIEINYSNDNTNFGEINFTDIVNFVGGSYSAGVFVTKQADNYSIEVLNYVTFELTSLNASLNGTYVLVGYINSEGEFVNAVKAKNKDSLSTTSIYVLQLKNAYQQTTEQTISNILDGQNAVSLNAYVFDSDFVNTNYTFVINNNYAIDPSSLTWNFDESSVYEAGEGKDNYIIKDGNENYHVLENTGDSDLPPHKIEITSNIANMLYNLSNIGTNNIKIFTRNNNQLNNSIYNNITILNARFVKGIEGQPDKFIIEFSVENYIQNECFVLAIQFDENKIIYSPNIYIDSNEVEQILMNGQELSADMFDSNMPKLEIAIDYLLNEYVYTYSINGRIVNSIDFFNTSYSKNGNIFMFTPSPAFTSSIKEYNFNFVSQSPDILTFNGGNLIINQITGNSGCVVAVNCNNNELERYFRIVITASDNFSLTKKSDTSKITEDSEIGLKELVEYKYNGIVLEDASHFTISNLSSLNTNFVQDGNNPLTLVDATNGNQPVITISQKDGDWIITKSNRYNYIDIDISFDVFVKTAEKITVSVSFICDISAELNFQNYEYFYAGTKIMLVEKVQNREELQNKPMFIIKDTTGNSTFRIAYKKIDEQDFSRLCEIGTTDSGSNITHDLVEGSYIYQISLLVEDIESVIATYSVSILPNIKISQTDAQANYGLNLQSNSKYDINNLVTLKQFATQKQDGSNIIYGSKNEDGSFNLYNELNLINLADSAYENLKFSSSTLNFLTYISETKQFATNWIENVGGASSVIRNQAVLTYGSLNFPINVIITNSYNSKLNIKTASSVVNVNLTFNYKDLFEINAEENWILNSVSCIVYEDNGNSKDLSVQVVDDITFKINLEDNYLSKNYKNAKFTFTLSYNGKTLIYSNLDNENVSNINIDIEIAPFAPELKNEILAYSNESFNLVTDVFDILNEGNSQKEEYSQYFYSISIESVSDSSLISTNVQNLVYILDPATTQVSLANFVGNSKTLTINYLIEYKDANRTKFNLSKEITILNYQSIETNYPFKNFATAGNLNNASSGINLTFISLNNNEISATELQNLGRNITSYEPVSTGETICFDWQNLVNLNRVIITNRVTKQIENAIADVKLVAYSDINNPNIVSINNVDGKINITFNNSGDFSFTYLAFKIITNSGNYTFYIVRYYNNANNSAYTQVNPANHSININNLNNIFYTKERDELNGNSYKIFGNQINLTSQFGINALTGDIDLYLYLLDYKILGSAQEEYELNLKNKLNNLLNAADGQATFEQCNSFVELKIALIMDNNSSVELYIGNIVAYIRPSQNIEANSLLSNEITGLENGRYLYDWPISAQSEFNNPFVITGYSGKPTINIQEVKTSGFSAINNEGTDALGNIKIIFNSTNAEVIRLNNDNQTINRLMYTFEDLEFVVKYHYDNGLDLFITFIMQHIDTPSKAPVPYSVGEYNGINFVDNLTINCYDGKINITNLTIDGQAQEEIDGSNGWQESTRGIITFNRDEQGKLLLTFELSNKYSFVSFDIEYLDIASSSTVLRRVEIDVNAAIYIHYLDSASGQENFPIAAKFIDTNYENEKASEIVATNQQNSGLQTYTIGELTITTLAGSKLEITIDQNSNFVIDYSGKISIDNTSGATISIGFTHSAQELIVMLNVKVLTSNGLAFSNNSGDISRKVFVKIPQTYIGITPVYLIKDATHENVAKNTTIENIRNVLFSNNEQNETDISTNETIINRKRIALKILQGGKETTTFDFNENAIGFLNENNPNYIKIARDVTNSIVDSKNLHFADDIVNNIYSSIRLSNEAGVIATDYQYQIIAGTTNDGINVLPSSDYVYDENTEQFNFIVNQNKQISYTIARLLDLNNTAFYVTEITPTLSSLNITRNAVNTEISYTFNYNDYNLKFTKTSSNNIAIEFKINENNNNFSSANLVLKYIGEGGKICTLKLGFYNCEITNPDRITMYTGTETQINELLKNAVKINNAASDGPTISFDYNSEYSSYSYKNERQSNINGRNKVFECINNKLSINPLSENAQCVITFKVLINGNCVTYVQINVDIICNFAFYVNFNNSIANNVENGNGFNVNSTNSTAASTFNYYLTGATSFPKNIVLTNKDNSNENFSSYVLKDGERYYSYINIMIYRVNDNNPFDIVSFNIYEIVNENGAETEKLLLKNAQGNFILTLENDFTGLKHLKLVAGTLDSKDNFVRYLNLNILGFISFEYTVDENYVQVGGGLGFKSGKTVSAINNQDVSNLGVSVISSSRLSDFNNISISSISYAMVPSGEQKDTIKETFDAEKTKITLNNKDTAAELDNTHYELSTADNHFILNFKLPNVDSSESSNRKYFIVIYKIELKHFGQSEVYYASYLVYNDKTLSVNGTNNTINVDDANNLFVKDNNYYLRLFQFSIDYTIDNENKYTMYYDKDNNVLKLALPDGNIYSEEGSDADNYVFTNSQDGTKSVKIQKSNDAKVNITIKDGTETTSSATRTVNQTGKNVVFMLKAANFDNFKEILNYSISLRNISGGLNFNGDKGFTLQQIDETGRYGLYGINLTTSGGLFNNEFLGQIVIKDNGTSLLDTTDLRLTTTGNLTPKGSFKLSQIFTSTSFNTTNNVDVIGVGNPYANWVKTNQGANANSVGSDKRITEINNVSIPTLASGETTYYLNQATWSGTGIKDLYTISQTYYYLSGGTLIKSISYNSAGATFYVVPYTNYKPSISVSDMYFSFSNINGTFTKNPITNVTIKVDSAYLSYVEGNGTSKITVKDLSQFTNDLGYLSIMCTIDGIRVEIRFTLKT